MLQRLRKYRRGRYPSGTKPAPSYTAGYDAGVASTRRAAREDKARSWRELDAIVSGRASSTEDIAGPASPAKDPEHQVGEEEKEELLGSALYSKKWVKYETDRECLIKIVMDLTFRQGYEDGFQ
ncbi:hypothetical protein FRC08_018648 [Ceratobasidium sp. 394]|nr:hypothetical protein FRC08_018648 [Ceratobasidium sp. 394]